MPAREFAEWRAYFNLEPFGQWRDNYHAAMIAHLIAQAFRDKRRPKPEFEDFLFKDQYTRDEETEARMLKFFGIDSILENRKRG
jgi:hypothetical protein